ncbi:hypothetical protein BDV97DRAFT_345712 [Delphinella strobiligena]|nr:hypothetical protein BDV97DRAFT_345712 [Delphinella strobiligena]
MSPMSKKLFRELHIDANASLGGGSSSSSFKRKRRSVKMDDDGGGEEEKGGKEVEQEEEGNSKAKEGGKSASSLPPTPPSSHNTTSPRNTTDLSHLPHEEVKRAVNNTSESHVAPFVESKKDENEMRDEMTQSSEATIVTQEEVNDPPSHRHARKITDFFRKTPKSSTTTTTKVPTAATMPVSMSTQPANSSIDEDKDKDKLLESLATTATTHMAEDGFKPSSVSFGGVRQAQAVTLKDKAANEQSRKDSVSSSSAPSIPRINAPHSHAKRMASPSSTSFTITSPSLRHVSTALAPQQTTEMTELAEMTTETTPALATKASKTRRASAVSSTSSATSSHGTDDHRLPTSVSTSDAEHDNQKSNPAPNAPNSSSRRASKLSNVFINTMDAKPATHKLPRKSNAEVDSSELDESEVEVDDQATNRKRKPGIVCADTMIKNWKRYGYLSAKHARKEVGRILANDAKSSNQQRDADSPEEADGVEQPKVRRQARKGTVRVETMIKNWGRYNFANATEARAVSAGLSPDTELGVDEIAKRLRKYKAGSNIDQLDDIQADDSQPGDSSEDELGEASLETLTPTLDSALPVTAADVFTLETKTSQQHSPLQSHDDIMHPVTDPKAARALKKLTMDVSPGIFGSPSDTTGRRSRERKRKMKMLGEDADAEVLPITPSVAAAMAPPLAKRMRVASPLTPDLAFVHKTTPTRALPPTSDPATSEKATPTIAQNPSPLRNGVIVSPALAVSSDSDKKTAKKQKELERLRMDVSPGIFTSKSASPRSTRGERKRDALVDLGLPLAPATNPPVHSKKSDQGQDKKTQNMKDKEKDEQKQTQTLKRTNPTSLLLPDTSPRAIAPPAKRLKLTFGPKRPTAVSTPSSTLIANPRTSSISVISSQQQTGKQASPLPSDIVGNGPIPRFIHAEATTPSAVAVDCEHVEKGWMVINPVYIDRLYDYINDLDTENDDNNKDDEEAQANDRQGEKHDEVENARQADVLTTEQEKSIERERNEVEWEKIAAANVAESNKRMLKEVEMIMTWSVMTDAEKRDAGIAD